jgi:YVTN family beta-propeller protein
VAVTLDGSKVYITNQLSNTVSVIDSASNTVTATVSVGTIPFGVAVTPNGSKVYVTNNGNSVSVIDSATDTVIATIPSGGNSPLGVSVTPDGSKVYEARRVVLHMQLVDDEVLRAEHHVAMGGSAAWS